MVIETNQEKETYALGVQMGQSAKPGAVYTLVGDLGVGKTVFTQGFAAGLGVDEPVNSPTFTIVQIYEEGRLPFYHFDVYRIGDVEEMEEIGPKNLRPPAISPMVRERREASARAELEGR